MMARIEMPESRPRAPALPSILAPASTIADL